VEWLAPVLSTAGSALVGAVATDVWQTTRSGVGRLFGRGGERRQDLAERWADQTAAEIERAPAEQQDQVRAQWADTWRQRLADLVDEYPEVGEELRTWAEQVRSELPADRQSFVNVFVSRDESHQYNAPGGTVNVHHHP